MSRLRDSLLLFGWLSAIATPAIAQDSSAPRASSDPGSNLLPSLPPGHPPINTPSLEPRPRQASRRLATAVFEDPTLKPGTLVVQISDAQGKPVPGAEVLLSIQHKIAAQTQQRIQRTSSTDSQGVLQLESLGTTTEYAYQVQTHYASVNYSSEVFGLSPAAGKRVSLLVFQSTQDIDAALVGIKAFVALEPREHFLQVQQLFHFANLSNQTWIIPGWFVPLAASFRAFRGTEDDDSPVSVQLVEDQGFKLSGFVKPGDSEVTLHYQIPYSNEDSVRFKVSLPPRVALLRVWSSATGQTRLLVEGMPEPIVSKAENGQRLLLTERLVAAGQDQIESSQIEVQGLPAPGPGRWYALVAAILAVSTGLGIAFRNRVASSGSKIPTSDLEKAKQKLLEEFCQLDRARRSGELGPKTYEQVRWRLLDALCRLLLLEKTARKVPRS